jgi:TolB-like protein/DNA-binding winged helix-turn-helix (wHTH) protein
MSGTAGFRFGDFEANVAERELRRGGFRVRLQDLPFRLLVALAERPGELVTRETLQKILWPAETYGDFGHRLGGALNRLREALGDSADHPRMIETVPRRGYRFCGPLERIPAAAPIAGAPPPVPAAPAVSPRGNGRPWRLASALALALVVSAGAWRVPTPVEGDEPTGIAVLPFSDLAGADQALCDGLTEDTITGLSHGALSVIGRTSVMAYRATGKRVDEIGRELGVPYVVEGSVRRGPRTVRVTVRLLAARTQTPVWSESYEGEAGDPLALQARVAREIAKAVRARVAARRPPSAIRFTGRC